MVGRKEMAKENYGSADSGFPCGKSSIGHLWLNGMNTVMDS